MPKRPPPSPSCNPDVDRSGLQTLSARLANIGDARSLIIHSPRLRTGSFRMRRRYRPARGPDVVRLSIGLEDVPDIIADLEQGLVVA